jgi:2-polyprenylphenol 6-hydroxylase
MNRQVDVAIVGGGLVGAALARGMEHSGLEVVLLDQGSEVAPRPYQSPERQGHRLRSGVPTRVTAFNAASQALLARVGGWPALDRIGAFSHMLVWDARGTARIEFDAAMIGEAALGYIAANQDVLSLLHAAVRAQPNVSLLFDSRIDAITPAEVGYRLSLADGQTLECQLLVGADGGASTVRDACGIRSVSWGYHQRALVSTIETERPHGMTARQVFTAIGPLGLLPLPGTQQNLCSIVWSTAQTDLLQSLSDEALCARLTQETEGVLGQILAIDERASFPLQAQHAVRYVRPHLALAGDAAHTIHPLAGQGAGLGLADAEALSMVLNECRGLNLAPGDLSVLRRYERMRRPHNIATAVAMEAFKRLYDPDHPAINWIRNTGTRWVDGNPLIKRVVMRLAAGR